MLGKILGGRYKIISHLGGGGFGKTYLAIDSQLPDNAQCVVKQLKPIVNDPKTLEAARRLFDREAVTLHRLGSHDQIPRLLAHFEEEEEFYLVQEYVEGYTLSEELQHKKRLSEAEVFSILQDILSILQYVHQEKVIHRDIKPSNLIRRKQDLKIVLIDFGAVKQISHKGPDDPWQTSITTAVSTLGYTPIEQLEGYPRFNSDIYALGMTAIQLLTGKHPKQLQRDVKTGLVMWREGVQVSNQFAAILDRAVCSDWTDRYQSVNEVLNETRSIKSASSAVTEITPNSASADTHITSNSASAVTHRTSNSANAVTDITSKNSTVGQNSKEAQLSSGVSSKPGWRRFIKPGYILGMLGTVGAILGSLELIHPIFRPIYYLHQGQQLLKSHKPEQALENFEKITDSIKPDEAKAWKGKGDSLMLLERLEGAQAAYNKALQLQPNDPRILDNKGKVLYQLGRYQEALDTHEQAIKIAPDNAQCWNGKGMALIGLQRYQEALAAFNKAQEIKPQDPTLWQSKGLALQYLQRQPEAMKVYEEALAVYDGTVRNNPDELIAWVDRGTVLMKLNRPREALDSYEKALKINPDFSLALLSKGNALISLQRYDDALKVYDKTVEISPKDYIAWHNRGELLAEGLHNYQEAVKSYEKALQLKPRFYEALLKRGLALTSLKQYSEALADFDKAKDIEPNNPWIWTGRGLALEQTGKKPEAIASYQKAIQVDPKFQPAIDALKRLK